MAETPKLPVDKLLAKLRRDDAAQSKRTQRSQTIAELDEETRRLRAMRTRLERGKPRDQ